MTTEQKAKAYDEALKLARDYHEDKNCFEYLKGVLENIFYELKESEDERIRKELIAEVKYQIEYIPAPDCRDKEDEKTLKQLNSWLAWLEKQSEQKPQRMVSAEAKEALYCETALDKAIKEEVNAWLEKQGDKTSKWTEEDEERLQSCISTLQGKGLMGGVDTINTKWLKSLKQRMEEK